MQSSVANFKQSVASYNLWLTLAWMDVKLRYKRSGLGPFWITLSMAIFCITLGVVYSKLFKTDISEYLPFLSVGFVVWNFISILLNEAPEVFVANASYIKDMKVNFFNIIFRAVSKNTIIFLHNAVIIIGIYLYFGINPGSSVFFAVPGIALVIANLWFMTALIGLLGTRYRDITPINQSIIQIAFFITPIIWFPRLVSNDSWIIAINPFAYFLEITRGPLLGTTPSLLAWIVCSCMLAILAIITLLMYQIKARKLAFWL